jgi:hypothetical protein
MCQFMANIKHDSSFCEGFFYDVCNFLSLIFFLATITHNMTPRQGFTLFGLFLKFLYPFEIIFKRAGMKIHSLGLSLAILAVDL